MEDHQSVHDESEGYVCSKCGAVVSSEDKVCPKCGAIRLKRIIERKEKEELTKEMPSERYPALRTIARVYQVLAQLIAIVAGIGVLLNLANLSRWTIVSIPLLLIVGAIGFVTCLAVAECIKVFIDIEENTRQQK